MQESTSTATAGMGKMRLPYLLPSLALNNPIFLMKIAKLTYLLFAYGLHKQIYTSFDYIIVINAL